MFSLLQGLCAHGLWADLFSFSLICSLKFHLRCPLPQERRSTGDQTYPHMPSLVQILSTRVINTFALLHLFVSLLIKGHLLHWNVNCLRRDIMPVCLFYTMSLAQFSVFIATPYWKKINETINQSPLSRIDRGSVNTVGSLLESFGTHKIFTFWKVFSFCFVLDPFTVPLPPFCSLLISLKINHAQQNFLQWWDCSMLSSMATSCATVYLKCASTTEL